MWAESKSFIWCVCSKKYWNEWLGGVKEKYNYNSLFLWNRMSTQINSSERLTQLFEISWDVYFPLAAVLMYLMWWDFLRDFTEKLSFCSWDLPWKLFAGAGNKKPGQAMEVMAQAPLVSVAARADCWVWSSHHPCGHTFAGAQLVPVLSFSLPPW